MKSRKFLAVLPMIVFSAAACTADLNFSHTRASGCGQGQFDVLIVQANSPFDRL